MGLGIGGHTKPNRGDTVVWLTPPELLRALGSFDLDPCAAPNPRPWPTAINHIELPCDGLLASWTGRVWLNPPYDKDLERWMARMGGHGSGIALIFARTETDVWQSFVWPHATSVLFLKGRLYFHKPDGSRAGGNAGGPSALVAYSEYDTQMLQRSGIEGAYVAVDKIVPDIDWLDEI